jgi:hypothetical protein
MSALRRLLGYTRKVFRIEAEILGEKRPQTLINQDEILKEHLRQAVYSFNAALILTTIYCLVFLAGIIIIFSGKLSEGSLMTACSAPPIYCSIKFAQETSNRLERLSRRLPLEDAS